MSAARLAAVVALAVAAGCVGCVERNPDYCADASAYGHSCTREDAAAAADRRVKDASTDTGEVADVPAEMATDATDATDAKDAVIEKSTCSLMSCGADGGPPICDVDAGTCGACTTALECVTHDPSLHGCESGQCFACTKSTECTDLPTRPICGAHACRMCAAATECVARDASLHGCDATTGQCFPCTKNAECTDAATQPICDGHACRPCKADAECGGAGVCLEDGHCAKGTEVVYVEFSAGGCPGADGTTTKPLCTLADALALVGPGKTVIVLRGQASDALVIHKPVAPATGLPPLVLVGRKNGLGEAANVSFGLASGIVLEAGELSVRDVLVSGTGTSTAAIGIRASGEAKLKLQRVTVSGSSGLGISVASATLTMDQCLVEKVALGGLATTDTTHVISNSIFASNGYGVKIGTPRAGSLFWFNTIVGSKGNALTCDAATTLATDCLIQGFVDTCMTVGTLAPATPTFDADHLPPAVACATQPTMAPAVDFNGAPRTAPFGCGALQK
ncbi:MAG: Carboxylesterase family protein [Myxococcales bacterium]|nr:Carboxylesterase family protein [Myxococcales bacterium]